MTDLVIYHDHCTDGFAAAFVAWMALGDKAVYLPMNYGQVKTVDDLLTILQDEGLDNHSEIYIVDFSLPKEVMEWLFANAKRVIWLDHHKTAFEMYDLPVGQFEEIIDNRYVELDNYRSGAMIAWDFFNDYDHGPMFVQHIDDRDRWQFKIPKTEEFHLALASLKPWSFEQWYGMFFGNRAINGKYEDLYLEGEALLRMQKQMVESIAGKSRKCVVDLYEPDDSGVMSICNRFIGLAVNSGMFMSEVGHELANQSETYGLIYYIGADNKVKCSFRSNGDYDVSAIAKSLGGGGHRNAAGCEVSIETLMGWLK